MNVSPTKPSAGRARKPWEESNVTLEQSVTTNTLVMKKTTPLNRYTNDELLPNQSTSYQSDALGIQMQENNL